MDHQEALALLGLKGAKLSEASIRDAFRAAVKNAHPDAGGDEEQFNQLVRARSILLEDLQVMMPTIEVRVISDTQGEIIRPCPTCHGHAEKSDCKACLGRGGACRRCRGRGYIAHICPQCENFGTIIEYISLGDDTITLDGELHRIVTV